MKIAALAIVFVFMLEYSLADNSETFHIEWVKEGYTDILQVRDSTGKLVEIIDIHQEEDFQVIKPNTDDDNVCLIFPALTKDSKLFGCYERVPFPREEYSADKLAECGNREIFFLRQQLPEYCSNKVDKDTEGAMRRKRSCTIRESVVTICVRFENVCVRRGWWSCDKYEYRCAEYKAHTVATTICD